MIKINVVVVCTDTTVISRAISSFLWQNHGKKALHIVNVGGLRLPVCMDLEDTVEDIRIYNVSATGYGPVMENLSEGLTVFFSPDLLYMPWHLEKMATDWIHCDKKAYSSSRGLTRAEEGHLIYTNHVYGLHNTIFQSSHVQQYTPTDNGFLGLVAYLDAENQVCIAPNTECPSIFYEHGPITGRPEPLGVSTCDYSFERNEFETTLSTGVITLDELTPRDQYGRCFINEMSIRNMAEIEEVKKWVPRPIACVCVISDDTYHTWQALVMLHNFRKYGLSSCVRLLVYHQFSHPSPILINALANFPEAQVFYYKDTGADMAAYKSAMRPHTLKKHFQEFPFLKHYCIFYHDADIIFTEKPDLRSLSVGPHCYTGDTREYIGGATYLTHPDMGEHGRELLEQMAGVVGINPEEVLARDAMSGGAQYILKDVDAAYWEKVEKDSVILHLLMNRLNRDLLNPSTPESFKAIGRTTHVQPWCADMWAVLWNLWLRGKDTPITIKISHSWATEDVKNWNKYPVHHNAGVTLSEYNTQHMFAKWQFVDKWPENIDLQQYNDNYCSFNYAKEIKECFNSLKAEKKE